MAAGVAHQLIRSLPGVQEMSFFNRAPSAWRLAVATISIPVLLVATALAAADPERIPLWNGPAPVGSPGTPGTETADAFITVHQPEGVLEGASPPAGRASQAGSTAGPNNGWPQWTEKKYRRQPQNRF